ncbi:hypothetical protein IFM89_030539 [Coptis chinensis]|uniref:Uncharacterized protein n=1 Tax=Coptis chinensis TaxID=261450 RepID=A0A835LX39_9MAGN|nr:hypothetical protein IFM89_030539 [Coptis chinensis]
MEDKCFLLSLEELRASEAGLGGSLKLGCINVELNGDERKEIPKLDSESGEPLEDINEWPGGAGSSRGRRQRRGEDVMHPLKVSLEELYNGTSKKLSLSRNAICSKCKRLALMKDPDYVKALVLLRQALLQLEMLTEATVYLERVVTKMNLAHSFLNYISGANDVVIRSKYKDYIDSVHPIMITLKNLEESN